jgi:hypothetical protein
VDCVDTPQIVDLVTGLSTTTLLASGQGFIAQHFGEYSIEIDLSASGAEIYMLDKDGRKMWTIGCGTDPTTAHFAHATLLKSSDRLSVVIDRTMYTLLQVDQGGSVFFLTFVATPNRPSSSSKLMRLSILQENALSKASFKLMSLHL